jgi:hypothetical protein
MPGSRFLISLDSGLRRNDGRALDQSFLGKMIGSIDPEGLAHVVEGLKEIIGG